MPALLAALFSAKDKFQPWSPWSPPLSPSRWLMLFELELSLPHSELSPDELD